MTKLIRRGDALDLLSQTEAKFDPIATDPPYAFGETKVEHALSATVAIVLRESASRLKTGGWMLVMCASSWRSTSYMVEAVRGIVAPVRIATWCKDGGTTKVQTAGWRWSSVNVIAFRRGKSALGLNPNVDRDFIICAPEREGRTAQLPWRVANWVVAPFIVFGGKMLDPFAGSGALVNAASEFGMDAIGFEKYPS